MAFQKTTMGYQKYDAVGLKMDEAPNEPSAPEPVTQLSSREVPAATTTATAAKEAAAISGELLSKLHALELANPEGATTTTAKIHPWANPKNRFFLAAVIASSVVVIAVALLTTGFEHGSRLSTKQALTQSKERGVSSSQVAAVTATAAPPATSAPAENSPPRPAEASMVEPAPTAHSVSIGEGGCKLHVESRPSSSEVWIDNRSLGTAPLDVTGLRCGWPTSVVVRRSQYAPFSRTVASREGETAVLFAPLEHPMTWLTIESNPPGAQVRVNQHEIGVTPVRAQVRAFALSIVEVAKSGFETVKETTRPGLQGQDIIRTTLRRTTPSSF